MVEDVEGEKAIKVFLLSFLMLCSSILIAHKAGWLPIQETVLGGASERVRIDVCEEVQQNPPTYNRIAQKWDVRPTFVLGNADNAILDEANNKFVFEFAPDPQDKHNITVSPSSHPAWLFVDGNNVSLPSTTCLYETGVDLAYGSNTTTYIFLEENYYRTITVEVEQYFPFYSWEAVDVANLLEWEGELWLMREGDETAAWNALLRVSGWVEIYAWDGNNFRYVSLGVMWSVNVSLSSISLEDGEELLHNISISKNVTVVRQHQDYRNLYAPTNKIGVTVKYNTKVEVLVASGSTTATYYLRLILNKNRLNVISQGWGFGRDVLEVGLGYYNQTPFSVAREGWRFSEVIGTLVKYFYRFYILRAIFTQTYINHYTPPPFDLSKNHIVLVDGMNLTDKAPYKFIKYFSLWRVVVAETVKWESWPRYLYTGIPQSFAWDAGGLITAFMRVPKNIRIHSNIFNLTPDDWIYLYEDVLRAWEKPFHNNVCWLWRAPADALFLNASALLRVEVENPRFRIWEADKQARITDLYIPDYIYVNQSFWVNVSILSEEGIFEACRVSARRWEWEYPSCNVIHNLMLGGLWLYVDLGLIDPQASLPPRIKEYTPLFEIGINLSSMEPVFGKPLLGCPYAFYETAKDWVDFVYIHIKSQFEVDVCLRLRVPLVIATNRLLVSVNLVDTQSPTRWALFSIQPFDSKQPYPKFGSFYPAHIYSTDAGWVAPGLYTMPLFSQRDLHQKVIGVLSRVESSVSVEPRNITVNASLINQSVKVCEVLVGVESNVPFEILIRALANAGPIPYWWFWWDLDGVWGTGDERRFSLQDELVARYFNLSEVLIHIHIYLRLEGPVPSGEYVFRFAITVRVVV